MRILAIDPGPEKSAWLWFDADHQRPETFGIDDNVWVATEVQLSTEAKIGDYPPVVVERVRSYGMAVGADVFETCEWIGRFDHQQRCYLMERKEVKMHLCNSMRAKDANIRQALIDRFGPGKRAAVGLKKSPGPLYGIKSHLWSALALAVTYADLHVE